MLSIKKNLLYNFLLSASQVLLPLITIPYVSRVLAPDGIGRVSFIDSFTYYCINLAEFGIMVYGIREVARWKHDKVRRDKLVSELLGLHLITSLIAVCCYGIAMFFLYKKVQDPRLILFSLAYLLVNSFACEWYFMGMERFRYIALRSLLMRFAGLILLFLIVRTAPDYYLYYGIMVLAAIASSLWNNIILLREVKISFRKLHFREHIQSTKFIYAINVTGGITLMLDNVLLGLVCSAWVVGLYAFAVKIVRTVSVLITDSLLVFFPRIIALRSEGNEEGVTALMRKNLQLLIFFGVPLAAGTGLLAGPVIRAFLGRGFEQSITCLRILAIFPLLKSLSLFYFKQVLIAHNKEKLALRSLLAGNLLFIPLTLVLSRYMQQTGAAIALIISEIVVLSTSCYFVVKHYPVLGLFRQKVLLHASLAALFFLPVTALGWYWQMPDLWMLLFAIPVCILVYIFVQLMIMRNPFSEEIKAQLRLFFQRRSTNYDQIPH